MLRIKICGITNLDDGLLACKLGADAVGFILYPKSPRYIPPETAAEIARRVPAHVARIGVFVNTPPDEIQAYLRDIPLSAAQLHGDYTLADFQQFPPEQAIAVARVKHDFTPVKLQQFEPHAAAILLDTHKKGVYGGTGETFDWQAAVDAKACLGRLADRIVLAGGLNPANVRQAVDTARPYAVDVSSGVEAEPGKKDPRKLRRLFHELEAYRQDRQPESAPAFPNV